MTDERCRTCGRAIYMSAITDHVGRRTSELEWLHRGGEPTDEHDAQPSYDLA